MVSKRHVLVTGGGTGVGAAIAVALHEAGMRVTVAGRRREPLEALADRRENMFAVTCDVTDEAAVAACFETACELSGAVDIVVANAGAALAKPFLSQSTDDLKSMLDVNLAGVFNVWKEAVADMKQAGWGRLVAIASTAGIKGYPYVSTYCAAKHGVVGLTRALAQELAGTGITVNAVCPGYTETELLDEALANITAKTGMSLDEAAKTLKRSNPQGRFVQPAEVADAVLWLCGDGAASINGIALPVAGGEA